MTVSSVACLTSFQEHIQTLERLGRGAFLISRVVFRNFHCLIRNDPNDINGFGGMRLEINREFVHVQNNCMFFLQDFF